MNATTNTSSINYYSVFFIALVFVATVSISDAKEDGLRGNKWLVTDLFKEGIYDEENGFEGSVRTILAPVLAVEDSSDSSSSDEECYVSFQKEDNDANDHCEYQTKVITASEAD